MIDSSKTVTYCKVLVAREKHLSIFFAVLPFSVAAYLRAKHPFPVNYLHIFSLDGATISISKTCQTTRLK